MQALVEVLFSGADCYEELVLATREDLADDPHIKFITRSAVVVLEPDDVEFISDSEPATGLVAAEDLENGQFIAYGPEHVTELRIVDAVPPLPQELFQAAVVTGFKFAPPYEENR